MTDNSILIIGASGQMGTLLVNDLCAAGLKTNLILASRDINRISDWKQAGFKCRQLELDDSVSV